MLQHNTIVSCIASLVHMNVRSIAVSFIHTFISLFLNQLASQTFSRVRHVTDYASVNSNCALPPSPPGNCGAFARLVSPGGGALANLARPWGRAFANPGNNPEKFVDAFKGMFS